MNEFQRFINRVFTKAMKTSMFNRWIVFVFDLFWCLVGYIAAIFIRSNLDANEPIPMVTYWGLIFMGLNAVFFYLYKSYRGMIRHSNFQEMWRIFFALFSSCFTFMVLLYVSDTNFPYRVFLVQNMLTLTLTLLLGGRWLVVSLYNYTMNYYGKQSRNTLLYGIGDHSIALAQWINRSPRNSHIVQGFLVREEKPLSMRVHDKPVFNLQNDNLDAFLRKYQITHILFPNYKTAKDEGTFVSECIARGLQVMVTPPWEGVDDLAKVHLTMRPIQFEDLLGREEISIDLNRISSQVYDKVILITGAAGSIGSELVRQISGFGPKVVVLFDVAETPLHNLRLELEKDYPNLTFEAIIGDVRNVRRLEFVFSKFHPELVYHAAAYKHVPMMEENPCESILVNVMGTKNLTDMSIKHGVKRFVMVSTDKAVNPTNVMGATKRMAEIYVQTKAKDAERNGSEIKFVTTRFGNVLGSNGSVIPHFKAQIERGGPVTVTHPDIIRYFMTIPEACRLVLEAGSFGLNGEIYVFDMGEPVKIIDLARKMIEMAGLIPDVDINILYTGLRPGEKLYEELLNNEETTLPTQHEKIMVANVRQYDLACVERDVMKAIECASNMDISTSLISMKALIPEYISQNSPWEIFDKAPSKATV